MAAERVLVTAVHVDGVVYPAGADVPDEVAERITNPKAWGEEPTKSTSKPQTGEKTEPKGYADQSGDDLKAVLKERELPTSGNKAELVARLEADDAEKAAKAAESAKTGE